MGDKQTNVVYKIPCGCGGYEYIGETKRKWATRQREHQDKVRLTQRDIDDNNMESALKRMNSGDAGLAKHDQICPNNIEWHNSKIIGQESNTDKRKFLEAIESIRVISNNKTPLNTYAQMEQWKPFLDRAFKRETTTCINEPSPPKRR